MVWDANPSDPPQFALRGVRRHQRVSRAKSQITNTHTNNLGPAPLTCILGKAYCLRNPREK